MRRRPVVAACTPANSLTTHVPGLAHRLCTPLKCTPRQDLTTASLGAVQYCYTTRLQSTAISSSGAKAS